MQRVEAELRNVSKNRRRKKVSTWTELNADKNEWKSPNYGDGGLGGELQDFENQEVKENR